jgi:hypothetical protein
MLRTLRVPAERQTNRHHNAKGLSEELLKLWLSISPEGRKKRFAPTDRAAQIAGVARRTLQEWIEIGQIQSLRIGKKHYVDLASLGTYLRIVATKWVSEKQDPANGFLKGKRFK